MVYIAKIHLTKGQRIIAIGWSTRDHHVFH